MRRRGPTNRIHRLLKGQLPLSPIHTKYTQMVGCSDAGWTAVGDFRYGVSDCNLSKTALVAMWGVVLAIYAAELVVTVWAIRTNYVRLGAKTVLTNPHGVHKFLLLAMVACVSAATLAAMKVGDVARFSVGNEVGVTIVYLVANATFYSALVSFLVTFLNVSLTQARFTNSEFSTRVRTLMRRTVPFYVTSFWICNLIQGGGIFDANSGDQLLFIGSMLFAGILFPAAGLAWYTIHLVVQEIEKALPVLQGGQIQDDLRRKKLEELQRTFKIARLSMLTHPLAVCAVLLTTMLISVVRTQYFAYVYAAEMFTSASLVAAMLHSVTASHRQGSTNNNGASRSTPSPASTGTFNGNGTGAKRDSKKTIAALATVEGAP